MKYLKRGMKGTLLVIIALLIIFVPIALISFITSLFTSNETINVISMLLGIFIGCTGVIAFIEWAVDYNFLGAGN